MSVTLNAPSDFDVSSFAESTRRSLELLVPWSRLTTRSYAESVVARKIVARAQEFIRAIKTGVDAAQAGFTVAEEAISLAKIIPSTTDDERRSYLVGMLELVDEGRAKTEKTLLAFKSVRQEIYKLTDELREQMKNKTLLSDGDNDAIRSIEAEALGLREGVAVLETFAEHISKFLHWWNFVAIESTSEQKLQEQIVYYYTSLNDREVIKKWQNLKIQYANYTDMASHMEDAYPQLFLESMKDTQKIEDVVRTSESREHWPLRDILVSDQHMTTSVSPKLAQGVHASSGPKAYPGSTLRSLSKRVLSLISLVTRRIMHQFELQTDTIYLSNSSPALGNDSKSTHNVVDQSKDSPGETPNIRSEPSSPTSGEVSTRLRPVSRLLPKSAAPSLIPESTRKDAVHSKDSPVEIPIIRSEPSSHSSGDLSIRLRPVSLPPPKSAVPSSIPDRRKSVPLSTSSNTSKSTHSIFVTDSGTNIQSPRSDFPSLSPNATGKQSLQDDNDQRKVDPYNSTRHNSPYAAPTKITNARNTQDKHLDDDNDSMKDTPKLDGAQEGGRKWLKDVFYFLKLKKLKKGARHGT